MRKAGQLLLGPKLADKLPSKNLGRELDTAAVSSARAAVKVEVVPVGFSVTVETAIWKVVVTEPDATEVISFSSRFFLNPPCFNSASSGDNKIHSPSLMVGGSEVSISNGALKSMESLKSSSLISIASARAVTWLTRQSRTTRVTTTHWVFCEEREVNEYMIMSRL